MFFKGATIALIASCITQAVAIDFTGAGHIWTNDGTIENRPIGSRAFRRKIYDPSGKHAKYADILINVDDSYKLFVNEAPVGGGTDYRVSQLYHVPLARGCNTIAVSATNVGGPAAVRAKIKIHYTDGTTEDIVTDQTWRVFGSVPAGFEAINFPDGNWPAATVELPESFWAATPLPADAAMF